MTYFVGNLGNVRLRRNTEVVLHTEIRDADVTPVLNRVGFDGSSENLLTGDKVTIRTNDPRGLLFFTPLPWAGLLAGLGYWVFGLDEPWFWGAITGFMSFIPVVGTAAVWIPAGIYQLVNGETWQGWGILLFGLVIITNIDNVVRFALQKKFADVHPLITVLGVIVGLRWFGITGIVFGPLLISYFLLMIKMYREEFDA